MLSHMRSMRKILPVLICLAMLAGGAALYAQDAGAQAPAAAAVPTQSKIDTGDTAWVFVSTALVLAMITPALITGAYAERMKFSAFILFTLLWATFIYDPLAHWVWGVGGWIRNLGALDFAGGTVVHISSGMAGLASAIMVKQRLGHGKE